MNVGKRYFISYSFIRRKVNANPSNFIRHQMPCSNVAAVIVQDGCLRIAARGIILLSLLSQKPSETFNVKVTRKGRVMNKMEYCAIKQSAKQSICSWSGDVGSV